MVISISAFLLFFLPFIVFPFGVSHLEVPKVLLFEVLTDLLVVLILFRKGFSLKQLSPTFLIITGLVFAVSLYHLVFYQTGTTFFGNAFRLQGVLLLWHLLVWSLISSLIKLKISGFLYGVSILGLLLSTVLVQVNDNSRATGLLGEPNALAAAVLFVWPFAFYLVKLPFLPPKVLQVLIILAAGAVVFLSGSRSGVLGLLFQGLFLLLNIKLTATKSILVICILMLFSLALPFIEEGGWYENRSEIWFTSLVGGFYHPLLGGGFGNTEHLIKKTAVDLGNNLQFQYIDSAHNIFLNFWLEAGFLGIVIILLLTFETFKNFTLHKRKTEFLALIGLLTVMLFNPLSVVNLVAFWWLIGQGFKLDS